MTLLPLVERELRVAARQRSTVRLRLIAALVAFVIGAGFVILTQVGAFPFGAASLGQGLFATLTWLGLATAMLAGPFLTSDCLSVEKRDGTLGFLFLTDLRGYDVVLGKLAATSLRAGFALLAIVPILGVALMMGGVTGAQFWKTALALGNALLLSLTAGLFCSAISRDAQKSLGATVLVIIILVGGGPMLDGLLAGATGQPPTPVASLSSAGYLFVEASAWGRTSFWSALWVNQLLVWALLGTTCFLLRRSWQDRGNESVGFRGSGGRRGWFEGDRANRARRRKLLELNPVVWSTCREPWLRRLCWLGVVVMAAALALFMSGNDASPPSANRGGWFIWSTVSNSFVVAAYLGAASQAGRFLAGARRSGLLELLLVTPLTESQIVGGQWRGWLRMFGLPLALCLILQAVGGFVATQWTQRLMTAAFAASPIPPFPGATNAAASAITNSPAAASSPTGEVSGGAEVNFQVVGSPLTGAVGVGTVGVGVQGTPPLGALIMVAALGTLTFAANLLALLWVGMWLGLTSPGVNLATLKTLLYVQICPWFFISFLSALTFPLLVYLVFFNNDNDPSTATEESFAAWMPLVMPGVAGLLSLAKDIGFVVWARGKLSREFRARAVLALNPVLPSVPPVIRESARPEN